MTPSTTAATQLDGALPLPCGQVLPNRLMRSALSEGLADERGRPTDGLARVYRRWSESRGYGLIVTGNVMVDARQLGEIGNVVVEHDAEVDRLRRWAECGKAGGNRLWMQINHPGRQANPMVTRMRPVAPSAVKPSVPGAMTPRALTGGEIEELVARYGTTAAIAKRAGFDGVQLHGAHGYLIPQFLSPDANRRTDDWGGSATNRARFVREIVRAVRAAIGPDLALSVKLNSADFQRGGFSEEDSLAVIGWLVEDGVDLVEVSGGTYGAPAMMGQAERPSTRAREAYFQDFAERVRAEHPTLALALTGGFRTRDAMQGALDDGACDVIGIGRPPCADPRVGAGLLDGTVSRAAVGTQRVGARRLLRRLTDLHLLDGAIDLQWHADQIHRMAAGHDPDPHRTWLQTLGRMVRRYGVQALRPAGRRG